MNRLSDIEQRWGDKSKDVTLLTETLRKCEQKASQVLDVDRDPFLAVDQTIGLSEEIIGCIREEK